MSKCLILSLEIWLILGQFLAPSIRGEGITPPHSPLSLPPSGTIHLHSLSRSPALHCIQSVSAHSHHPSPSSQHTSSVGALLFAGEGAMPPPPPLLLVLIRGRRRHIGRCLSGAARSPCLSAQGNETDGGWGPEENCAFPSAGMME